MNTNHAEKICHQLHHCINLMHRSPCHGHGNGQGRGEHRGQGRIIALLHERNGIGQRELAELLHVRPPSLSELLDKLESAGMIERRQNQADKRMSQVFLTEKGQETASRFETAREERRSVLLSGLTENEQQTLSDLLEKFLNSLQDQFGAGLERGQNKRSREHHEHGPCVGGHGHRSGKNHHCQCNHPGQSERGPCSTPIGEEDHEHAHPCRGGHGNGRKKHQEADGDARHGCCGGKHHRHGSGCG